MKRRRLVGAAVLCVAACAGTRDDFGDGAMELPKVLREVSGVTAIDANTVACVQDENGAIWLVDLRGIEAAKALPFGGPGDYEGLARVGDDYWVLRSDGWLGRIAPAADGLHVVASLVLPSGHREWEALCWHAGAKRLLVMPKHPAGDGKRARDVRPIYTVDPDRQVVDETPLLELRRSELLRQAAALGEPLARDERGKDHAGFALECSEIAVVPGSGDLLLLSAVDHALLRVAPDGRLLAWVRLDAGSLPQPEGMTFLSDGRLVLASEGRGHAASLRLVAVP